MNGTLFVTKPIPVTAEQFRRDHVPPEVQFGCECGPNACCSFCGHHWVDTLDGRRHVREGDYVVRHPNGNLSVWSPERFGETFARVHEA